MPDSVFIEHGFKVVSGVIVGTIAWLLNRAVKAQDEKTVQMEKRTHKVEKRIDSLEQQNIEIAKMSVKLDMVIQSSEKTNKTLDKLDERLQGTELGLARIGGKRKDD